MRRLLRSIPLLALGGGMMTGLALVLSVTVLLSTQALGRRNCQQIELVKTRIRTVIAQGAATLGQPGSALYAYYLAHPAELAQARHSAHTSLDTFRAGNC